MSDERGLAAAIIVAGGVGERFGRPGGKQMAPLLGRPVVEWVLEAVTASDSIGLVVLVCHEDLLCDFKSLAERFNAVMPVAVVPGGATRRASVAAGLAAVPTDAVTVVVHDGARPLVTPELIDAVVARFGAAGSDGLVVGHGSIDTVKVVSGDMVIETPDRASIWAVQTPQVFTTGLLRASHRAAALEGFEGTDDASIVEHYGGTVRVFEGPRDNIKVTTPEDIHVAEHILKRRMAKGE